jgi:protocatechuate 3,4-dioxygenase beta subunit
MVLTYTMFASNSLFLIACLGLIAAAGCSAAQTQESGAKAVSSTACAPTAPDGLGPFYTPNAPVRSSVGKGYSLSGVVRSSEGCSPISGARIEFWLAGPDGKYDDDHRATVLSGEAGRYEFESNSPPAYGRRPPHIHVRVTAAGHETLVTQHYPAEGQRAATFDLVLVPAR